VCSEFFPKNIWPGFEEYKGALEMWLNTHHPNYLAESGEREWTNAFAGKHHSAVLIVIYRRLMLKIYF